ncbi:hypothetical protein D3C87_1742470 [compost metagenome]
MSMSWYLRPADFALEAIWVASWSVSSERVAWIRPLTSASPMIEVRLELTFVKVAAALAVIVPPTPRTWTSPRTFSRL